MLLWSSACCYDLAHGANFWPWELTFIFSAIITVNSYLFMWWYVWRTSTNLSISSSYNKPVTIRLVAICHLHTCYTTYWNKLQQACRKNQLATSLLTTCNRLVVISCHKPCKRILISSCCNKLLQDVNRLVTTGCVGQLILQASSPIRNWSLCPVTSGGYILGSTLKKQKISWKIFNWIAS